MAVHVAIVGPVRVNTGGSAMDVVGSGATIQQVITSTKELRILEDPNIPNSTGNPTIKTYIEAEDADGYVLRHMDNVYIITVAGGT